MKLALIFPGQGSQTIGMAKDFLTSDILDFASSVLGFDFHEVLNDEIKLNQTEYSQPAILLSSIIIYKALKEKLDFTPSFLLGHSLGEFSALVVSGALKLNEALMLVHKRGLFMKEACANKDVAMMAVLGLDDELLEALVINQRKNNKQIWCANFNSDGQVVLAGLKQHLVDFENILKQNGARRALLLNMSVASHCPLLENAALKLKKLLNETLSDEFSYPIISNANTLSYDSKLEAVELLYKQLTSPVLYKQSINQNEDKCDIFVECGSSVLKGLNKRITKKPTYSIVDNKSLDEFLGVFN